jgi:hypothetical protein
LLDEDWYMTRDVREAILALYNTGEEAEPKLEDFVLPQVVCVYPSLVLCGQKFGSRDRSEPFPTRASVKGRPNARNSTVLIYLSTGKPRVHGRARHVGTIEYEPCSVTGYVVVEYSIREKELTLQQRLSNLANFGKPQPPKPMIAVFARLYYHASAQKMEAKPTHTFWRKHEEKKGSAPYRLTPVHRIARSFVPVCGYHDDEESFTLGVLPSPFVL